MKIYKFSQLGKRSNNEDSLGVNDALITVCDGMGGHVSGERASAFVVNSMLEAFVSPQSIGKMEIQKQLDAVQISMNGLLDAEPELEKMGTTFTGIFKTPDVWYAAHIGDSRIYLFRPSEQKLWHTWDHSLVGELMRTHEITVEGGRFHPMSNRISKAIIARKDGKPVSASIVKIDNLKEGDVFLLCSDGVIEGMSDVDFVNLFSNNEMSFEDKCKAISRQCDENSKDNNTAILVEIEKDDAFAYGNNDELEWTTFAAVQADYDAYMKEQAEEEPGYSIGEQEPEAVPVAKVEVEKKSVDQIVMPPQQPQAAPRPQQPQQPRPAPAPSYNDEPDEKPKSKTKSIVIILLVIILAIAAGLYFMRSCGEKKVDDDGEKPIKPQTETTSNEEQNGTGENTNMDKNAYKHQAEVKEADNSTAEKQKAKSAEDKANIVLDVVEILGTQSGEAAKSIGNAKKAANDAKTAAKDVKKADEAENKANDAVGKAKNAINEVKKDVEEMAKQAQNDVNGIKNNKDADKAMTEAKDALNLLNNLDNLDTSSLKPAAKKVIEAQMKAKDAQEAAKKAKTAVDPVNTTNSNNTNSTTNNSNNESTGGKSKSAKEAINEVTDEFGVTGSKDGEK